VWNCSRTDSRSEYSSPRRTPLLLPGTGTEELPSKISKERPDVRTGPDRHSEGIRPGSAKMLKPETVVPPFQGRAPRTRIVGRRVSELLRLPVAAIDSDCCDLGKSVLVLKQDVARTSGTGDRERQPDWNVDVPPNSQLPKHDGGDPVCRKAGIS